MEQEKCVTVGQLRDRVLELTHILARKEYSILFITKEKDFYKRAFKETHDQNRTLAAELQAFQAKIKVDLSESKLLQRYEGELRSQLQAVKEVSAQLVDALAFYKDLQEVVAEREYDSADMLCSQLNVFLRSTAARMQNEVLQTDRAESRIAHLEAELSKIRERKDQFDQPDCNLVYAKQLQINIDGDVASISASVKKDQSAGHADDSTVTIGSSNGGKPPGPRGLSGHRRNKSSGMDPKRLVE